MSETPCSRAAALENPALSGTLSPNPCSRAAALENPAKLFEKSLTKTLVVLKIMCYFQENLLSQILTRVFCPLFSKKWAGLRGGSPLAGLLRAAALNTGNALELSVFFSTISSVRAV